MTILSTAVDQCLKELNWDYEYNAISEIFEVGTIKIYKGYINMRIVCDKELPTITICSTLPHDIPDSKKIMMYDLLNRINDQILLGSIYINNESSIISMRTCGIYQGCNISSETVHHLLRSNIQVLDYFIPAIMNVIYSNVHPAIAFIENNQ
jgi:hypothetical protein